MFIRSINSLRFAHFAYSDKNSCKLTHFLFSNIKVNPSPKELKWHLLHVIAFPRTAFGIKTNSVDPDQTAPLGAV